MSRTALVLVVALFAAELAHAQDWPGWRGGDGRAVVRGLGANRSWPEKLRRAWSIEVGTGHSTPALVDGRLYVQARRGEDEVVTCLDAKTGRPLWTKAFPTPYKIENPAANGHGKGPRSSPAVAGGRVHVMHVNGDFRCLDAKTGKELWKQPFQHVSRVLAPLYGASMSPVVFKDRVFAHVGYKEKGGLVQMRADTGKRISTWAVDGPSYATPIIRKVGEHDMLMMLSERYVVGLEIEHFTRQAWRFDFTTQYEQNSVSPVVVGDHLIISGYHRGVFAHDLSKQPPALAWRTSKVSMYMSTPVVREGHLYGFSEKRKGQFFCQDGKDGAVKWTGEPGEGDNAALVLAGDEVIAVTTDSDLIVFRATPKAYREVKRYRVAETPVWAHPVVTSDAIFVKDLSTLTRWEY